MEVEGNDEFEQTFDWAMKEEQVRLTRGSSIGTFKLIAACLVMFFLVFLIFYYTSFSSKDANNKDKEEDTAKEDENKEDNNNEIKDETGEMSHKTQDASYPALNLMKDSTTVSYTHLTLPTNREV